MQTAWKQLFIKPKLVVIVCTFVTQQQGLCRRKVVFPWQRNKQRGNVIHEVFKALFLLATHCLASSYITSTGFWSGWCGEGGGGLRDYCDHVQPVHARWRNFLVYTCLFILIMLACSLCSFGTVRRSRSFNDVPWQNKAPRRRNKCFSLLQSVQTGSDSQWVSCQSGSGRCVSAKAWS